MNAARIVKVAKALADPARYKMLRAIQTAGELNCSQVCDKFPLSQPTISHHLKMLHDAGLITVRKEGQYHVLAISEEVLDGFAAGVASGRADSPRKKVKRKALTRKTAPKTARQR